MLFVVSLVCDCRHDNGNILIVQYFVPIQFVYGTIIREKVRIIKFGERIATFGQSGGEEGVFLWRFVPADDAMECLLSSVLIARIG